jgi:hypothetical protein
VASQATVAEIRESRTLILRDLANVPDSDRYDIVQGAVENHDTGYKIIVGLPRVIADQIHAMLLEWDRYAFEHA